ncbi:phosphonoacetaldehyde hydrolase [Vibrio coralliirubri]|uniref:phosphonoacetaldehyde hydrolase n=1 Tax=Vibrio coralliirubri TaxID=1516159 RepID=UPI0006354079|nr:phosphonoacetaldehyde hydrolase [Vibrio coralliirubri]CDT09210.1 Predicted phosphatase/phosphohexomutase [Vibrio coralliirubri]CDT77470.1 Predicted phosphatase/phosphohexomutase [Vibrio coralliirubri]CDT79056.1 Predicted phosphatase/phosphohexomutase [Vibrio coralliirubri]
MKTVEAVIFDWAGTTVDFGSFAPTTIFVEAFKAAFNFEITLDEARGPMGMGKWDHIRTLGNDKAISERWVQHFGTPMTDEQVTDIYNTFMPLQIKKVQEPEHSSLIPGTAETLTFLAEHNIKVGSCSGYPRPVMEALIPAAAANGYQPDCVVASDDLPAGSRPGPWMALQNVIELGVTSVSHCIKVDDSVPGIDEGLNAGMWTVGLSLSGNEAGFTLHEFLNATDEHKANAREFASKKMHEANAHYVIDTIADLPSVITDINRRIAAGERP